MIIEACYIDKFATLECDLYYCYCIAQWECNKSKYSFT